MTRTACTGLIVAVVANWAGAQVAAPSAPANVLRLRTNADLLENLLGHGVAVSDAPDPIGRADECRKAVGVLGDALSAAAGEGRPDAARVAELADRTADLLETGLAPVLDSARDRVRRGSPGAERLAEVERDLAGEVADYRRAVSPVSRLGGDMRVIEARAHLERAGRAVEAGRE